MLFMTVVKLLDIRYEHREKRMTTGSIETNFMFYNPHEMHHYYRNRLINSTDWLVNLLFYDCTRLLIILKYHLFLKLSIPLAS